MISGLYGSNAYLKFRDTSSSPKISTTSCHPKLGTKRLHQIIPHTRRALTARTAEDDWVILDVLAPGVIVRFAGRRRAR